MAIIAKEPYMSIEGELTPRSHWSEMYDSDHFVQFYRTDAFLLDALSGYISTGLREGDACIVIATQEHREHLEERLQANGLDMVAARTQHRYISLDAGETLAEFMVDGLPEPGRFTEIVGNGVMKAVQGQRMRIFGEMVAFLWKEGNQDAALSLEELWNDLHKSTSPFLLFCAYPMHGFAGEAYEQGFAQICKHHSRVIPDESYTTLVSPDERLRAITLLQQKARSLEAEVAERKAAEECLRASEARYHRLFEASTDGILIVDPCTCTIIDANPSMAALLGYPREQLLGQHLWQIGLFQNRAVARKVIRELQEKQTLRYEALPIQTQSGQRRYVEFVSILYPANGQEVIQCNMRDITARKQAEDERRELEERKDAFISMASHELKTPITSLKGFTQILHRRLKQQADSQALLFLDRMNTQLKKLTDLISDLLDVSKMRTGVLALRETDIDFDELVREIMENIQAATHTHTLHLQGETHAQVYGDRERLEQVLINLLTNAIKYSPRADTVIVHLSRDAEQVEVAVQDFGIGIAEAHHERLFERFYRVDGPYEKTYPGLGIGLYIAHTIVKCHGGRLWLESQPGAGSTFHFTLPLHGTIAASQAEAIAT